MNENIKNIAEIISNKEIVIIDDNTLAKLKLNFSEAIPFATALDKSGYRKQSETVKEFAEKLKKECHKAIAHNDKAMDNREMPDEMWYVCNGQNDGLDFVLTKMNELATEYGKEEK